MAKQQVPPPEKETLPAWVGDQGAVKEEKNWPDEEALKGQKRKNDVLWLKIYGFVVASSLIVFALLFLGSLVAWSLHYLLPVYCHWLSADQLTKIQSILFSGSIGGVVSLIAQKQFLK